MSKRGWAVLLVLWIGGILFPFEALRQYSPSYRQWFDFVFDHQWVHILVHGLLFAVLAGSLKPMLGAWRAVLVALIIAGLQETIQAMTGPYDVRDRLFDVGVDAAGAIAGTIVWPWDG